MISQTTKKRTAYKIDKIFWFIVALLPVLVYLTVNKQNASAPNFFTFLESFSPFSFVSDIFDEVTQTAFNTTFAVNDYLAYVAGVEVFHVMFDVVVFIPRLAHKWISKAVQDE